MRANNKPFCLGLTGGIASGKTEAGKKLCELGAEVIDADIISRGLTGPEGVLLPAIRERFGDKMFSEDGALKRRSLGDWVFSDEAERRALECIVHPAVQREMLRRIDEAKAHGVAVCVLMVPLLYETAMDAMCDEVWVVSVEEEEQVRRIMQRDGLSLEKALARIKSQMDPEERERLADLVIRTNRPIEQTAKEIRRHYEGLLRRI